MNRDSSGNYPLEFDKEYNQSTYQDIDVSYNHKITVKDFHMYCLTAVPLRSVLHDLGHQRYFFDLI